ncbi:methylated-DNA--[protein]-cysteine S-methyltransferase [Terasakiella sp. SH-1]|uniref:methylated-DNA--[protein]-cysteine S-methyltransferase n=1 Tax=Terasakiella sp. SH-1 TaxID=2560057 RepID=UPI001073835F|nr:methylated-DNA--[protein]-cysteine S-methyltransferase [Terasakiella sp. SH-1]
MIQLYSETFPSPCGELSIVFNEQETLLHLDFPDQGTRQEKLLTKRFGRFEMSKGESHLIKTQILAYLTGDLTALDEIPCQTEGTDFQKQVWHALKAIPCGQTWSYKQLAQHINNPKAIRAVARANALNPISLIYPCHRVIGSNGTLTGYAGGLKRKEWLLRHEGAYP